MRILLLTVTSGLYNTEEGYHNGGGWVASLQQLLESCPDVDLSLAFPTDDFQGKVMQGRTVYYSLQNGTRHGFSKLFYYWGGYRKDNSNDSIKASIINAIDDFQPDIIHIFGTESKLPYALEVTDIPCVIHIQGHLGSCVNYYFPPNVSEEIVKYDVFNRRELILHNGQIFNYRNMKLCSERERQFIKECKYFMGRTDWDRAIMSVLNPSAKYFRIEEVLRPEFYKAMKWEKSANSKLIITSTLSDGFLKGVDFVLRTAKLMRDENFDFEWRIIGVTNRDFTVKFLEKRCHIKGNDCNVHYLGVKTANEICDLLAETSVYVHTSYIDNSPNSLCEAQYLGVPVIATNVGGVSTLMKNHPENLVPSNDSCMLAYKLMNNTFCYGTDDFASKRHNRENILKSIMSAYNDILSDSKK